MTDNSSLIERSDAACSSAHVSVKKCIACELRDALLEAERLLRCQDSRIAELEELTAADKLEIGSYRDGTGLRGENRAQGQRIAELESEISRKDIVINFARKYVETQDDVYYNSMVVALEQHAPEDGLINNWIALIQDALENDWVSLAPKRVMYANVTLFGDKIIRAKVSSIHFWRGEPMRLFCTSLEDGKPYKFKYDEEPFEVELK